MRSKVVKLLALVLLLCGTGVSLAQHQAKKVRVEEEEEKAVPRAKQKSQPEKSKLEEMLAEALKNSPDIRVAVAKLAMAEAELNQARLQVMQKVFALHAALESQKAEVELRQKKYERFKELSTQGLSDSTLVDEALANLRAAKAKLAEQEALKAGLLGTAPAGYSLTIQEAKLLRQEAIRSSIQTRQALIEEAEGKTAHMVAGPMAEKIRKALQTPIKVDYKDVTFADVLKDLEKKAPGLTIRDYARPNNFKVNLHFEEELPVFAVLQALTDYYQRLFLVRDYGLLATTQEYKPPPGAMTVDEFVRQKPAGESRHQSSSGKNPPAENVAGDVKAVYANGLMTITIGSDVGLAKGHTLELFRLVPAPGETRYLGTIRILEVHARQAVAQPVGRLSAPAQAGDRVASRLLGK